MKWTAMIATAGWCAASAVAAPTMDLAGTWQVRLGEAAPAEIRLPGTLGDAGLGPEATRPLDGALTPRRLYVGPATYTRTITVSPDGTVRCSGNKGRILKAKVFVPAED